MNTRHPNTVLKLAAVACQIRHKQKVREQHKSIHVKQHGRSVNRTERALSPVFDAQVADAADSLKALDTGKAATTDTAAGLAAQIYNPRAWDEEIINAALPPLAQGMVDAATAQLKLMGIRVDKASTATEWLEQSIEDIISDETVFATPTGTVTLSVATEFPPWMKQKIEESLRESFAQDYWQQVNDTTLDDITSYLERGLRDGWSTERMAKEMQAAISTDVKYGKMRGRRIARTESANALNSARSDAIDGLSEELGPDLPIQKTWLSVLMNTTRDTHADLDGVPADSDGMWELGGVRCRWPGDIVLPPGERINCLCTVLESFGMSDDERDRLIGDYNERLQAQQI